MNRCASEGFACVDCGQCTCGSNACRDEYYMVQDELWRAIGAKRGMLCIGCLEQRAGRELHCDDFTDCGLNLMVKARRMGSLRLWQRLVRPKSLAGWVGGKVQADVDP